MHFSRDTGLYTKSLQKMGIESREVMPLPAYEEDLPDVLRAEYKDLENPEWWKNLKLDGVIICSWSLAKYTPIVKAIHDSGTVLIIHLDSGEVIYPWMKWMDMTRLSLRRVKLKHPKNWLFHFVKNVVRGHLSLINYPNRRRHFGYATMIGIPSPGGIESYKKIPWLLSKQSKKSVFLMPVPVAEYHRYDGTPKERRVLAIGRWEDEEQKRTHYLMESLEILLRNDTTTQVDLIGRVPDFLRQWHDELDSKYQCRVRLHGIIPNAEITPLLRKSKICLCPSMYEGTHIVSAEALCNGASVVVAASPFLGVVKWYTTHQSGRIARQDTPESFAQAISDEFNAWDNNERNPQAISDFWCEQFHPMNNMKKIFEFVRQKQEEKTDS